MTGPLRQDRPRPLARGEDIGDVLASIRKLIAQDAPGAQGGEVGAPAAFTEPAIAMASPRIAGDLPLSPARTAALTNSLAEAVDAAAARMADTARRVEAARAAAPEAHEAPFRLNPDALIPAAAPRHPPEPRLRLSPQLAVVGGMDEGAESEPGAGLAAEDAVAPAVGAEACDSLVRAGGGVVAASPSVRVEDDVAAVPSADTEIATDPVAAPPALDAPFTVVAGGAQGAAQVGLAEAQSAPGTAPPAYPAAAAPVATAAPVAPAVARPAPAAPVAGPVAGDPSAVGAPVASPAAHPPAAPPNAAFGAAAPAEGSRTALGASPTAAALASAAPVGATPPYAPAEDMTPAPVRRAAAPNAALGALTPRAAGPASTPPASAPLSAGPLTPPSARADLESPAPAHHPGHPTLTEQLMDAHPLRNLLREAIRDELRGELGQRLDGDLRRMVREELAAALTEAFGQAAR